MITFPKQSLNLSLHEVKSLALSVNSLLTSLKVEYQTKQKNGCNGEGSVPGCQLLT